MATPQTPWLTDAPGSFLCVRSGKFTVLQGWTRCGKISEIFTNMAMRSNQ